jgi:hypothetical protein
LKSRVISHVATGGALTTDLALLTDYGLEPFMRTYSQAVAKSITWTVDVDFSTVLQKAGLSRHLYLCPSAVVKDGETRKHLDLDQSSTIGVARCQPALRDHPSAGDFSSMLNSGGCRFIATPGSFDLSTKTMIIDNLVAINAPVFLHHHMEYLPVDVASFLPLVTLKGPAGQAIYPILDEHLQDLSRKDWTMDWTAPKKESVAPPVVYVRVVRSRDVLLTGFTDIEYSLFYPPFLDIHGTLVSTVRGWTKVAIRIENDSGQIDSVLYNGNKRV